MIMFCLFMLLIRSKSFVIKRSDTAVYDRNARSPKFQPGEQITTLRSLKVDGPSYCQGSIFQQLVLKACQSKCMPVYTCIYVHVICIVIT